ncbi:MAG: hypothetical protein ACR2NZ_23455 [Rubripirellula sp.]
MSNADVPSSRSRLRRDLSTVPSTGKRRDHRIVIDEVSGTFSRTADHLWRSLLAGTSDEQLWREADAAGWTRSRNSQSPRRSLSSLLAFRIPLGTIDRLAGGLAAHSGFLFAPTAVLCWSAIILFAAVMALSHSTEIALSLGSLPVFLQESNPVWIGGLFIVTKLIHEFAHAIVCRRVGGRVGEVGILLLCGIPCPYCDVTDIWRQPSEKRRAAVMLAGIYVELIIASLATFTWLASQDATLRLTMLNLMVICSVSTLLFNANPLMRYDGYFVLADFLCSVNLRREARNAFSSIVTTMVAGPNFRRAAESNLRSSGLAVYHVASVAYRLLVLFSIATLGLGIATYLGVRPFAAALILALTAALTFNASGRIIGAFRGRGVWKSVSATRRSILAFTLLILGLLVLFLPTRRYRQVSGWIDSADATMVYVGTDGVIERVSANYGDRVVEGESLLELQNESLALEQTLLRGRLNVAKLRRGQSLRSSLDRTSRVGEWQTLQAAEKSLETQLASVQDRVDKSHVRSPANGIVLPPDSRREMNSFLTLDERTGSTVDAHQVWCRVSSEGKLHAVLELDARDRRDIGPGSIVTIGLTDSTNKVWRTTVSSVSELNEDQRSVMRQASFQVLCPIESSEPDALIGWLGKECQTIVELPDRSLASDWTQWIVEWLGGE